MKRLALLVVVSLFTATTAMALPWTWDLTGTGYTALGPSVTGNIVSFQNDLGAASATNTVSTIIQSLGGDGILGNGDVFEELGILTVLDADNSNLLFMNGANFAQAYIAFSGLTGSVTNYSNGADGATTLANYTTNVADDSFDLIFNPGVGSIGIYLDTDINPNNGALNLATFTLLAASGSSPDFFFAGAQEGQFGLIGGFTSVLNNFWQFSDGTYFEDFMAAFGIPSIFMSSFNLGATFVGVGDDGTDLLFSVINEGSFQLSAIPEPSTILLLGAGLVGLGLLGRRTRKD